MESAYGKLCTPIVASCMTVPNGQPACDIICGSAHILRWTCPAGEQLHLMSLETYEQITVPEHLFGSAASFLAPDMAVTVNSTEDGQHLSGELASS